jgi:F-type H+-transporting ATPase subunit gamma
MLATRPYAAKIQNVVAHLSHAHPEYHHPYLIQREAKRVGLIIISTDRGLCGGLNINLFKSVITAMKEWDAAGVEIDLTLIGSKSNAFFKRLGGNITATATHLGDAPSIIELIGTVKVMLDSYAAGGIDQLYIAHNEFENTMSQHPVLKQLIPVTGEADDQLETHWDYIYEPDSRPVMDALMIRYIESLVYQSVVENVACEQAARMVAMKSATDNADDLIDELQLIYNKARQTAITQEISEIVSGAAAV